MFGFFKKKEVEKELNLNLHYGAYYASPSDDGKSYGIIRFIAADPEAIHYAIFKEKFDTLPTKEDVEKLEPFCAHIPQAFGALAHWQNHSEIYYRPLNRKDLDGYLLYFEKVRNYTNAELEKEADVVLDFSEQKKTINVKSDGDELLISIL